MRASRRSFAGRTLAAATFLAAYCTGAQGAEPTVQIERDMTRDAMHVRAFIDIEAAPAIVWGVIVNCSRAPQIVPNMESCRVVDRDPAGRWEIRETLLNVMLLPRIHSVMRNDFEPRRRMAFKRIDGDMRISEGEWRLEPLANGKATRLRYDAVFSPAFEVPQFLIEQAAARDFPTLFRAIERESLADAGKN
jgi:uncharacterized membrane protein